MNPSNPLESVYFIKLPGTLPLSEHALKIDPAVPIPVQRKDGEPDGPPDISALTEEQILSGILTVLAYDAKNAHAEYYRGIIMQARPGIKKELSEAAILKTRDEDWNLAEEMHLALHGLDPDDKAIILNMAIFYDQKADYMRAHSMHEDADAYDDTALNYYREAMDCDPEIPDAFFNAAFFHLKKHNYADAKGCLESYLALTSDAKDDELGESGQYKRERAQELIDKISNRRLENERFHLAYELISSGQEEKGLEEIRKFIQENPAVWNAWFMLGWGLRRLERFEDAKAAFLKARECEGGDENADTLNELAICQMETGDFSGAMGSLEEALSFEPENTKIISNMGCLFLKQGKKDEARKFFETVLALDPEDRIARMQLERI